MNKRDKCYLLFFITHVPILILVDLVPLYPTAILPQFPFLLNFREWYIKAYKDRFFMQPPPFFTFYAWMEAFIHFPVSVWAIGALIRDDPKLPVVLLVFAVQTAVTTATCISEYLHWEGFSADEKIALGGLYVPYLVLSLLMSWDMCLRLSDRLTAGRAGGKAKTT